MNNSYRFHRVPMSKYSIDGSTIIGRFGVIIFLGLAFLSLASCGGGGGGSSRPPSMMITPPPPSGGPDLVILSASVSDDSLSPGEGFDLTIRVRNVGEGPSAATTLRFKSHTSLPIVQSNPTVDTASVQSLGPSEAVVIPITLPRPSTAGTYYYGACVDAVSGESDTSNNCSGNQGVRVTVGDQSPPSGGPDLVIHSTSVSDDSLTPGQRFDLTVTVRNVGEGSSAATTLHYKSHTSLPIVDSNPTLITRPVPSFDPSQEFSGSISLSAPTTPGTYYYGACVDAFSGESDTSNNCSGDQGIRVTVSSGTDGGGPDDGGGTGTTAVWPCPFDSGAVLTIGHGAASTITSSDLDAEIRFPGNTCGNFWVSTSSLFMPWYLDDGGRVGFRNITSLEGRLPGIEFINYNSSGQTIIREYTAYFCSKSEVPVGGSCGRGREHSTSTFTVRWLSGERF